MAARWGVFAVLLLTGLPVAARADGIDVTIPDRYTVAPSARGPQLPPIFRVWDRQLDGVRHSIVASASPATADLATAVDSDLAGIRSRNGIDITRTDAEPLCGAPSVRVAYAYANQLTYVYRYAVVGGRLLIVSYAHPVGTTADPAALAVLDTLCTGVHQTMGPSGWVPFPRSGANSGLWGSPDLKSTLFDLARPAKPDETAPPAFTGKETVGSDRQEQCGTVAIRRVTAANETRTVEFVSGIVRGYAYTNTYTRPLGATPDAGALATLTSFCTETAPALKLPPGTPT